MLIDKNILTVEIAGVLRCCLLSLAKQIESLEIHEDTRLACKYCKQYFKLSSEREAHFIPFKE